MTTPATIALQQAITHADIAAIDAALAASAVIGDLPIDHLLEAADAGQVAVVEHLIKAGMDVHATRDVAIRHAAIYDDAAVVDCLIRAGANVNAEHGAPLRIACKFGRLAIVERLLSAGADVHLSNDQPLEYAAREGYVTIMERLFDAGADLHVAHAKLVQNGHHAAAQTMVDVHRQWARDRVATLASSATTPSIADANIGVPDAGLQL